MPAAPLLRTRVMSCDATVIVLDGQPDSGIERLHQLERRWSRFLTDSEISALNRAGGIEVQVSDDTLRLVAAMVDGWRATAGGYDPMLLGCLVSLGYAASRCDPAQVTSVAAGWDRRCADQIVLDRDRSTVTLPAGATIDPGGIGKGLAADIVVGELIDAGAGGALVEVGGDIRVAGCSPASDGWWTIAVGDGAVSLQDGGIATSTTLRRRWRSQDVDRHHLINPRTLLPSDNGVVECTVIAGTGAWAEVFTKVAFTSPVTEAIDIYERFGLAASIATLDTDWTTSNWTAFQR